MNRCHLMLLAVLVVWSSSASAGIWLELTPAGSLPSTAQTVQGTGPLDAIAGNLESIDEVDMFRIAIVNPMAFSATTIGGPFNVFDPQIFLFNALGMGVYMNDDADGSQSMLPAGSPLGPKSVGIYYLAIGWFDNEPFSTAGRIFADGSGTNGPDPVGGALPVSSWNGDVFGRPDLPTSYEIDLTGANFVPEPGTLVLLLLPLAALAVRKQFRPARGCPDPERPSRTPTNRLHHGAGIRG